jgi:3-deoxy-D-manno-octulosonate 8-phosphate phosphatase (KDO 8-P phosphatase)
MHPPVDCALLAFDYDGVFTDGTVLLLPDGSEVRTAHIRDGYAVVRAAEAGVRIAVISGGRDESVRSRMQRLGVTEVHLGVQDKLAVLDQLRQDAGLEWDQVGYCGDDVPDVSALAAAGWSACPADAVPEVQAVVNEIGSQPGGKGFVREVLESLLRSRGIW